MGYREVNFNLGCPSGTVTAKHKGAGLLTYPEELERCLGEIFSALPDMQVSVKTRIGKNDPEEWEALLALYGPWYAYVDTMLEGRAVRGFVPRAHLTVSSDH